MGTFASPAALMAFLYRTRWRESPSVYRYRVYALSHLYPMPESINICIDKQPGQAGCTIDTADIVLKYGEGEAEFTAQKFWIAFAVPWRGHEVVYVGREPCVRLDRAYSCPYLEPYLRAWNITLEGGQWYRVPWWPKVITFRPGVVEGAVHDAKELPRVLRWRGPTLWLLPFCSVWKRFWPEWYKRVGLEDYCERPFELGIAP